MAFSVALQLSPQSECEKYGIYIRTTKTSNIFNRAQRRRCSRAFALSFTQAFQFSRGTIGHDTGALSGAYHAAAVPICRLAKWEGSANLLCPTGIFQSSIVIG